MCVCVCVCVCVCACGSVRLTPKSTLTLLANPNYCSVHAAVQSGTPSRRKTLLKAEGPENINYMSVTVDTSCFVIFRRLARDCAPSPSQNSIHIRLVTSASTRFFCSGETAKKWGQECGGRISGGMCTMCGRRTGDGDFSGAAVCVLLPLVFTYIPLRHGFE